MNRWRVDHSTPNCTSFSLVYGVSTTGQASNERSAHGRRPIISLCLYISLSAFAHFPKAGEKEAGPPLHLTARRHLNMSVFSSAFMTNTRYHHLLVSYFGAASAWWIFVSVWLVRRLACLHTCGRTGGKVGYYTGNDLRRNTWDRDDMRPPSFVHLHGTIWCEHSVLGHI